MIEPGLFFELLQIALGTREDLSRVPSAVEWEEIFAQAQRQGLTGVLFAGVERLQGRGDGCMPGKELLRSWLAMTLIGEGEYGTHVARARELAARCREAGFAPCVLKGLSAARRYPDPARRQCGDIDMWVRGPRMEVMSWLRSRYKVKHVEWHHAGVKVFDDVPVEVHFHPSWLYNPWRNRRLQRWFTSQEAKVFVEAPDAGYAATPADFDAVFQLAHCFHHVMEEGVGMRHVVDYFYVMREVEAREETAVTLRSLGLLRFARAMMWILVNVCGLDGSMVLCEPSEEEGRWLLDEIMTGGNFGRSRTDGLRRNTFARWWMILRHYPLEALWMWPWKVWHLFWRGLHR